MIWRSATAQARTRKAVRAAGVVALLVVVAGLQWPALPVACQAGSDLPEVQQAVAPSESNAPSADTDLWQVVRVEVAEDECGKITRYIAPLSKRELSVACNGHFDGGIAEAEATMKMVFPHQMQGYDAQIKVSASGAGRWDLNDPSKNGYASFNAHVFDRLVWPHKCKQEYKDLEEGGSRGGGEFSVTKLECTYDPAVDFVGRDEVEFSFYASTGAGGSSAAPLVAGLSAIVTYKRCTNPDDCERPRKPVLVLHDIHGSYVSSAAHHRDWVLERGVYPNWLVIDPIRRTYDDLIQTLKNVGYEEGKDLFIVAYDWRLAPAPAAWDDSIIDGHVDGPTGKSITDDIYWFGVDYLGYWLKEAAEAWQRDHSETLVSVDVIAHGAGGLVARSYIQSNAYGDTFSSQGETMRLPLIDNLIMVAVPNRGASLPWQAMHNNFNYDAVTRHIYAKMLNVAYQKVKQLKSIAGFPQIAPADIMDSRGNFVGALFVKQYVWTYRSLLATYPFHVGENDPDDRPTSLNHDAMTRNNLLLDLNNGLDMPDRERPADASPFADEVGATTVIYAKDQPTPYRVREARGPASKVRWPIDAWIRWHDVPKDGIYYQDISAVLGDGTVPKESAVGQFEGDSRVDKKLIGTGDTSHTGLMSNKVVQQRILEKLGVKFEKEDISTGSVPWAITARWNAWCAIGDPVEMFLVDGSGRRLGYSQGTGAVTEIPNSVWFGDADGIGWVFDAVQGPLSLEMMGLGEDYYVQVSGEQVGMTGGMESSGTLAKGKKKTVAVETELRGTRTYLPMILRSSVPSAGSQTGVTAR